MKGNGQSLKKGSWQEVESKVSLPECPVLPPLQSGDLRCAGLLNLPMAIAPTNR
jgi:hypothetical protein